MLRFGFLSTMAVVGATGAAFAEEHGGADSLLLIDPYVISSGGETAAAFIDILNSGDVDERLVSASTDLAAMVELHTHIEGDDGVMMMRPVEDGFEIPPMGGHALERGGDHIMLMGLSEDITSLEEVVITLEFENTGEIDVPFAFKTPEEAEQFQEMRAAGETSVAIAMEKMMEATEAEAMEPEAEMAEEDMAEEEMAEEAATEEVAEKEAVEEAVEDEATEEEMAEEAVEEAPAEEEMAEEEPAEEVEEAPEVMVEGGETEVEAEIMEATAEAQEMQDEIEANAVPAEVMVEGGETEVEAEIMEATAEAQDMASDAAMPSEAPTQIWIIVPGLPQ